MLDRRLRIVKDRLLLPFARVRAGWLTPTRITLLGLLIGALCVVAAWRGRWLWAVGLFGLNRLADGLDGLLARARSSQSELGGYLDLMADFLLYATLPIAISVAVPHPDSWALVALLAVYYLNAAAWLYLSAVLEKRGAQDQSTTSITMPSGVVEGTETIVFYAVALLVPQFSYWLFWILAGLTVIGCLQRVVWALRQL